MLFVLRKDAYISMTSNMHAKIAEKNEILINLTVHCTLMKPRLTGFINSSFPPNTSDPNQDFFTSNEVYLATIFKKSNTGNPIQIQMQTKYKCSGKYELDLTMTEITEFQVTHVYFRIDDCFPTI